MAITDPGAVLIIGAGASVPFGLPLGGDLIDRVRAQIDAEMREIDRVTSRYHDRESIIISTRSVPMAAELSFCHALHKQSDRSHLPINYGYVGEFLPVLENLRNLLTGQTSETIDDFIAINPSVAELVKIGIAIVMFGCLYEEQSSPKRYVSRKLSGRNLGDIEKTQRRNWVHHLINIVRHQNFEHRGDGISKVRIISFNYDGVLETILSEQFDNTEHCFGAWQDYFEIIHPHGFMGEIDRTVHDPMAVIQTWAKAICVVKEKDVPPHIDQIRNQAMEWIAASKKLFMVGFALSEPNAELLGLGNDTHFPQKWYVSNYDGSPGLRRIAKSFHKEVTALRHKSGSTTHAYFGKVEVDIEAGTRDDPLHIDTWFQIGIPGKMPA